MLCCIPWLTSPAPPSHAHQVRASSKECPYSRCARLPEGVGLVRGRRHRHRSRSPLPPVRQRAPVPLRRVVGPVLCGLGASRGQPRGGAAGGDWRRAARRGRGGERSHGLTRGSLKIIKATGVLLGCFGAGGHMRRSFEALVGGLGGIGVGGGANKACSKKGWGGWATAVGGRA